MLTLPIGAFSAEAGPPLQGMVLEQLEGREKAPAGEKLKGGEEGEGKLAWGASKAIFLSLGFFVGGSNDLSLGGDLSCG